MDAFSEFSLIYQVSSWLIKKKEFTIVGGKMSVPFSVSVWEQWPPEYKLSAKAKTLICEAQELIWWHCSLPQCHFYQTSSPPAEKKKKKIYPGKTQTLSFSKIYTGQGIHILYKRVFLSKVTPNYPEHCKRITLRNDEPFYNNKTTSIVMWYCTLVLLSVNYYVYSC